MHKNHTVVLLSVLVIFLGFYAVITNIPHKKALAPASSASVSQDTVENHPTAAQKTIAEWKLTYPLTLFNAPYSYVYVEDSTPATNEGYASAIVFKYNPVSDTDTKWGTCGLPSISQYSTDPTNSVLGASPENVRQIGSSYYVFENGHQEPCSNASGTISGADEKAWFDRQAEVRKIFDSLQTM